MAFSPWQILSPVQWAKWTWSAVRGSGAGEDEAGGPEGDPEEEEDSQAETKSLSFRQVHRIPAEMQARAILPPRSSCVRATVSPALLRPARSRVPAVCPKVRMFCLPVCFRSPVFAVSFLNPAPNPQSPHPGLPGSLSLSVDTPAPTQPHRVVSVDKARWDLELFPCGQEIAPPPFLAPQCPKNAALVKGDRVMTGPWQLVRNGGLC